MLTRITAQIDVYGSRPGLDKPGITPDEARKAVRDFVDKYAPRGRVVATAMVGTGGQGVVYDELYTYPARFTAAQEIKRRRQG
jgi:hypothetical protein